MAVSKFEDTVVDMLINNIDKWYTGYKDVCVQYSRQVGIRYRNGGHGVVDLAVHIFIPNRPGAGNHYNFEIKSCLGDLNSGNGMNLYGMYNYLVYPHSLITTLPGILTYDMVERKLNAIGCDHAGIIGVISDKDFVVERRARRYNGNGAPKDIKAHEYKNGRV